ncbi:helix-turn-helix transcriptional regulator [Leifsonia poae]|uniref:helix-turn-helix transcriptional regulator n=1 Tax=Leifsonia poae TaxID=110933 RepID=UPI003D68BC16
MDEEDLRRIAEAHVALGSGRARELRLSLRMSVGDLGATVGVSGAAISRWETGRRTPQGETAVRYARVLEVLAKVAGSARQPSVLTVREGDEGGQL